MSKERKERKYWKVITPTANGRNGCFGNIFIGNTNEVHSESYISFKFSTNEEVINLLSYLKCKLPNLLLSLRKISQNISKDTCCWIPIPPLNKSWTDIEIYEYFKLSTEEINLINETNVKGYKNTKKE